MKKPDRNDPEARSKPKARKLPPRKQPPTTDDQGTDRPENKTRPCGLEELRGIFGVTHRFSAADICRIHDLWLGDMYEGAGEYRQSNSSIGDLHFASASRIPALMTRLEKGPLSEYTPCRFESAGKTIKALAVVHTELALIHPFRKGNGKVARMLSALMSLQAGLPPLDFRDMIGKGKKDYINAVQAGLLGNYEPMEKVFESVIYKTMKARGRR